MSQHQARTLTSAGWLQVDGIQRLAVQLQALAEQRAVAAPAAPEGSTAGGAGTAAGASWVPGVPGAGAATAMATAATILRWTAAELGRLSDKERQAVLRLPVDLISRITSRAAARTIKLLVQ